MKFLFILIAALLAGCGGGDYPEDPPQPSTNPPNCSASPKSCI